MLPDTISKNAPASLATEPHNDHAGYLLVQIQGSPREAAYALASTQGIERADFVTGPYDIIVKPARGYTVSDIAASLTENPVVHRALMCAPADGDR